MIPLRHVLSLVFTLIFLHGARADSTRVRIACVGASLTLGTGLVHPERDSFPARLRTLLGDGYEVRSFRGERGIPPREALQFLPNLVFLEFGTGELIQSFQRLTTRPRIVALLSLPYAHTDTTGEAHEVINDEVLPGIQATAFATGCELVNLYNYLLDRPDCFSDQNHLSATGAGLVAARLYDLIRLNEVPGFDLIANARIAGLRTNYYGFECYDFSFEGRGAKIVKPKRTARGCPWLWRGRYWGHYPQTEIALLERGFHLVYCDVAELFGNDEAIGIWNKFYEFLIKGGLAAKAAFVGYSRGGIYVYRWAACNPDRVACIYADAPVLDLKSWPGGKGHGGGNPGEWERFKRDFGLGSEEEALAFRGNPIDLAGKIAAAGFPMLHVCGSADKVVPIEENTDVFEKKILASGGKITVIRKPGVGHHPHSLANPQPIVDFILRAYVSP